MDSLYPATIAFLNSHADLAGPTLCLVSFASALFLVGIVVPVTASMLAAGAAVALGQWTPLTALWSMGGITAGSVLSYELGRSLPASSRTALARIAPRLFAAADRLVGRYGATAVVLSRFFGPPATVPFIAGYLGLPRPAFLAAATLSSLWVPTVMAIGYVVAIGFQGWTR